MAKLTPRAIVVFIVAVYLALTAVFCAKFFSWTDLHSHSLLNGDPALNAWALAWVSEAIVSEPLKMFGGNAFFPYDSAITLSEHMVSLAIFNVPVRWFSDSPWLGYNLLIAFAYFSSAIGGFLLTRYLTQSLAAAFWGGLFWGFMFFRVHHIGHLQILSYQWIPFFCLYLIKTLKEPRPKHALLFALFFCLQALTSWYLALVAAAVVPLVMIGFGRQFTLRHLSMLGGGVAAASAVILPFALPYRSAMRDTGLAERLTTAHARGDLVALKDFVHPPSATLIGGLIPQNPYWIWQENTLYVGFLPLAMAAVFVAVGFRSKAAIVRQGALASVLLISAGYLLALGFTSQRWGVKLPLGYLSEWFDFVGAIRATQRFALVSYLGILIASAFGLAWLLERVRAARWRALIVTVVAALFLVEVYPKSLPLQPNRKYAPSVLDVEIAKLQKNHARSLTILHLPIHYFTQSYAVKEATYLVDSTLHWANILNGFSGAAPAGFDERMATLSRLPADDSIRLAEALGVDVIAVHASASKDSRAAIREAFGSQIRDYSAAGFLVMLSPSAIQ